MFTKIDHIAIAVDNLEDSIQLYETRFHAKVVHREFIEHDGVDIAVIEVGDTSIELVEGKSAQSPIRKFVQTKGPGIHHIAFEVEDIRAALAELKGKSLALIDDEPRRGKEGSLVAFIHPKSTQKILYELVEKKSSNE
ncbi:MAG: methylmalonyl-CoA epimerase [Candidatus Latescibacterota bacterium]